MKNRFTMMHLDLFLSVGADFAVGVSCNAKAAEFSYIEKWVAKASVRCC